MVETWILVLFCFSITQCDTGRGVISAETYKSEKDCTDAGEDKILKGGRGMFGRAALCLKGVRKDVDR